MQQQLNVTVWMQYNTKFNKTYSQIHVTTLKQLKINLNAKLM